VSAPNEAAVLEQTKDAVISSTSSTTTISHQLQPKEVVILEQTNPALAVELGADEEAKQGDFSKNDADYTELPPPTIQRLERQNSECMMPMCERVPVEDEFFHNVAESIMTECPQMEEGNELLTVFDDDAEFAPQYTLDSLAEFLEAEGGDWLTLECSITAILFLVRFLRSGGVGLHTQTWRALVSTSILLAATVESSNCEAPASFAFATDIQRTKQRARAFLSQIDFNLKVSGSQYALYYFTLQKCKADINGSPTCVSGPTRQVSFRGWGGTRSSGPEPMGVLGEYEIPVELVR
jgi:hypothetical protein